MQATKLQLLNSHIDNDCLSRFTLGNDNLQYFWERWHFILGLDTELKAMIFSQWKLG